MKMETKKDTGSALKQALGRRQTGSLPSNFSFRMMEQIRFEAVRQQKRQERIGFISMLAVVVALVGGVAAYLVYSMNIGLSDMTAPVIPAMELPQTSSPMMGFYCYIAVLGFILLGLDYWLRSRRSADGKS